MDNDEFSYNKLAIFLFLSGIPILEAPHLKSGTSSVSVAASKGEYLLLHVMTSECQRLKNDTVPEGSQ